MSPDINDPVQRSIDSANLIFNWGCGSTLMENITLEMEASIMDGPSQRYGSWYESESWHFLAQICTILMHISRFATRWMDLDLNLNLNGGDGSQHHGWCSISARKNLYTLHLYCCSISISAWWRKGWCTILIAWSRVSLL